MNLRNFQEVQYNGTTCFKVDPYSVIHVLCFYFHKSDFETVFYMLAVFAMLNKSNGSQICMARF